MSVHCVSIDYAILTAGRIKEMLEAQLGIPADKQELKGLIKRKVDDAVRLARWLCFLKWLFVSI